MKRTNVPVSILVGLTLASVTKPSDECLTFTTVDGRRFEMYHQQDCCEHVFIESIVGDLEDLIGSPILIASEETGETPADYDQNLLDDSYTWTFYKFATRKGYVDIRWLGESNGYYSESVDFEEVK